MTKTLEYKNNVYLLETEDGEVFESYIPSPEEEAVSKLNETYGFSFYEQAKGQHQEQRSERIMNEQQRWGDNKHK